MVAKKSLMILSISLILLVSLSFVSAESFGMRQTSLNSNSLSYNGFPGLELSWFSNLFGGKSTGSASGDLITEWTQWFDRDNPSGSADWESLVDLKKENPGKICDSPTNIECQTTAGLDYTATKEVVVCDVTKGAMCVNAQQPDGTCNYDYKVRFYCGSPTPAPIPTPTAVPDDSTFLVPEYGKFPPNQSENLTGTTGSDLTGTTGSIGESCEILEIEEVALRPGDVGEEKGGVLNNRFVDFDRKEILTIDETFSTQLEDGKTYYIPIPSQQCYWEASYENGELYILTVCPPAEEVAA